MTTKDTDLAFTPDPAPEHIKVRAAYTNGSVEILDFASQKEANAWSDAQVPGQVISVTEEV